jgi:hypothetical protein
MLAFNVGPWTSWVPLGAGAVVTFLVFGSALLYGRWRHRPGPASLVEGGLREDLERLLEEHNCNRAKAGLPPEEPTEEMMGHLRARLFSVGDALPVELAEDRLFLSVGGDERRASARRWGNPTEVHLRSELWFDRLHGLVVNRSTGGIGIYADREIPAGTIMKVRALEAPSDVPAIPVEVRHCRKVGKGYFIGCQFDEDVPWNARAWLG